jgi:hypothetical protein
VRLSREENSDNYQTHRWTLDRTEHKVWDYERTSRQLPFARLGDGVDKKQKQHTQMASFLW